ncbi:bile acid-CoA:amino acid N-acyltransferase-like [Ptychodera flava]|uniref:bile acid-CoA:amino acid N-acyltransferase-like n=1 Tax=Ptychodera flava TaxID=63121 RepID=UPI003969EC94
MALVRNMEQEEETKALNPSPIITGTPPRAMIDESIAIVVTHLLPRQPITLYAYLISEKKTKWESWGHYVTDDDGKVKVECQRSQGGTYSGCEPMGLFWSMKPAPGSRKGSRLRRLDVMKPYVVHIQVFKGHLSEMFDIAFPIAMTTIERWYIRPGVKRIPITEGDIRGTLFIPNGNGPFPLIIDLWGGGGGIIEYKSSLLASHGFAAAVLAFKGHPDLPVNGVDIHYFEEACEYLCHRQDIDSENIGFIGTSHGTSIGFEIASESNIRLKCAVFTNGGFIRPEVITSRSFRAFLLPPWNENSLPCDKDGDDNFLSYDILKYDRILEEEGEKAFIKVENLSCPSLFLISGDDPSHDPEGHFQQIYRRLKDVGKDHLVEVLRYPQAGHLLEPPYAPLCTLTYMVIRVLADLTSGEVPVFYFKYGGSPKPHAEAQEHSWKAILEFFDKHLRSRNYQMKRTLAKL